MGVPPFRGGPNCPPVDAARGSRWVDEGDGTFFPELFHWIPPSKRFDPP